MNEVVISIYEENNITENQENETSNNITIKAKNFSITINLSDT